MVLRIALIMTTGFLQGCWGDILKMESGNALLSLGVDSPVVVDFSSGPDLKAQFEIKHPLSICVVNKAGEQQDFFAPYSSVKLIGTELHAEGLVTTAAGSVFHFTDIYAALPETDEFDVKRRVVVEMAGEGDVGFMSRFQLSRTDSPALKDQELFIPGICYQKNKNVPPYALAADLSAEDIVVREDRMPIPIVMLRDPVSGVTSSLIHLSPDGSSCLEKLDEDRLIDPRLQFASLGVQGQTAPALTLLYPGSEGSRTYVRPPARTFETAGWSERYHPVVGDVSHAYQVRMSFGVFESFPAALRATWRRAYGEFDAPASKTDVPASYEAGMGLINNFARAYNGCPGLPFALELPGGRLEGKSSVSFQMGFVGQQLPLAYHLIRYGLEKNNPSIIEKGEAMVDFWAANSLTKEGLPRTWFDPYPEPHWRSYNTFLRLASDGMPGALRAWDLMKSEGRDKPGWLQYCRSFGDWLVKNQNPDGSWSREYHWDGTPANESKSNTSHPIPFLLALAAATGETSYRTAALRAGDSIWKHVHESFTYVGGTPDQPNIIDREAGFMALQAFLALHDETGEDRWLEAAKRAADFTETWAYCWQVPLPGDDPAVILPRETKTRGFSIIATGHSGADLLLAGASFFYYRLYLKTGDPHYADVAGHLLHDTKENVSLNGSLGYGGDGLCPEVVLFCPPRGWSIDIWLPWLTYYMIDPIAGLQDAYEMTDTPRVEGVRFDDLCARDRIFGKSQGLRSPAKESSTP